MAADPLISFDGVSVRYPGAEGAAVSGLTFSVRPGERVALVGPSGAGKSTILALAAGLTLPSTGQVDVLGVASHRLGRRSHRPERSRIGIISQDFALVGPLRVATNVAAGRLGRWSWLRAARTLLRPDPIDEIAAALDTVGIAEKLWERADNLSGGQMQRTAVARALFQCPDLLLADEPVSALDPARSDSVMAVLAERAAGEGRAMIASMHDAPLALRYSDRIIAMRGGRIQFDRPVGEVSPALLEELYLLERSHW